jgi:protein phosphatase
MTTRPARDSLVTPLDPGAARRFRPDPHVPVPAQETTLTTAFARIDVAVASACGTHHAVNEDAHSSLAHAVSLFVDGVGGGGMAELASRELVAHLHEALDAQRIEPERITQAMLEADRKIARRIAEYTDAPGAATVVLCMPGDAFASRWLVAWVGDCRAYRLAFDGRGFEQLTRDDTFAALNEEPPPGGSRDDPARMVGNGATTGANVGALDLPAGDVLALCSDGVHKHLDAADWQRLLGRPTTLAQRCEALVATARANGSIDDATVLLVQRTRLPALRPREIDHGTDFGAAARRDR